jgi:DNA-binding transcriptional ArsR family regulator
MGTTDDDDTLNRLYGMVSAYFGLFAEPMRLRIMHALCDGERSVNAVVEQVQGTQANVSRHLAMMHKAGVLARRRDGNVVTYWIADDNAVELCRTVCTQVAARMDQARVPARSVKKFMVAA